ncbi:hypothetical protein LY76DRAFT_25090 [Colletotrichum caudatum]|nr:hypothetical protein LY76DRAFT_25090 [Colletotrichum caudatum]
MDFWNAVEAETKQPYGFINSNHVSCKLQKHHPVLLHRSQAPFRKPGDNREWVTITPLAIHEYFSKGKGRERCVPMLEDSHPRIVIPAVHIRMQVRVIRDFVPGITEYDYIAADKLRKTRIFRKGEVAMWDDFTMRPSFIVYLRCNIQTLQGFEPFEAVFPIPRTFVQFGISPEA